MSDKQYKQQVGALIRQRRLEVNISVTALSIDTYININSIYQYERGEKMPSFKNICKIAKVLDVDINHFNIGADDE